MTDATIKRFIDRGKPEDFDQLARGLVARQLEESVTGCESAWASLSQEDLESWQVIPPIGTSTRRRAAHPTADHELIAHVMQASWQALAPPEGLPVLLLTPQEESTASGAMALAIHHAAAEHDLTCPVAESRVDTNTARSWLAARQRDGQPATIVATVELLGRLLRFLERRRLRFRLPAGSRLITMEPLTEAAEGPSSQSPSVADHLALLLPATRRLIIVPTLTTPLLVRPGSDSTLILMPPGHWVRYRLPRRTTTPETQVDRLVIMDLATTRLPACQEIDLETVAGAGPGVILQG